MKAGRNIRPAFILLQNYFLPLGYFNFVRIEILYNLCRDCKNL